MQPNYTNFPRNFYEKKISCYVSKTAVAGNIFYFEPNEVLDNSFIIGMQFLPKDGYLVDNSNPDYVQATSSDASNALISLTNKPTENVFQDYPVNVLNNPGSGLNITKVVRIYQNIQTKKCFIKWMGSTPATNLRFIFAIYYKPL